MQEPWMFQLSRENTDIRFALVSKEQLAAVKLLLEQLVTPDIERIGREIELQAQVILGEDPWNLTEIPVIFGAADDISVVTKYRELFPSSRRLDRQIRLRWRDLHPEGESREIIGPNGNFIWTTEMDHAIESLDSGICAVNVYEKLFPEVYRSKNSITQRWSRLHRNWLIMQSIE